VDPDWAPIQEAAAAQVWRDILRPLAAELRRQAGELAAPMVAHLQAELPEVMPDAQSAAENAVSVEETIRSLALMIERGDDPHVVELPASAIAFARAGVHRQVPLTALMRNYRIGQQLIWQWFFDRIVAHTEDAARQATAVELISNWIFTYVDAAVTRAEQVYEVQREQWLRSAQASRDEAITAILSGAERDPRQASRRLRYELSRDHIGVVAVTVASADEDGDPHSLLSETVTALAAAVSADPPLIFPSGVTTCLGWISRARRSGSAIRPVSSTPM